MQNKWYILLAISLLAIIGFHQEPTQVHNQELIIHFSKDTISIAERDQTITTVKQQLASLGVKDVEVVISRSGTVSISYYSHLASQQIKNKISFSNSVLDKAGLSSKNPVSLPEKIPSHQLSIDVFDIQEDGQAKRSLEGTLLTFEYKVTRNAPVSFFCYKFFKKEETPTTVQAVAYKNYCTVSINWQQPSYAIPEVRAGPIHLESIS